MGNKAGAGGGNDGFFFLTCSKAKQSFTRRASSKQNEYLIIRLRVDVNYDVNFSLQTSMIYIQSCFIIGVI